MTEKKKQMVLLPNLFSNTMWAETLDKLMGNLEDEAAEAIDVVSIDVGSNVIITTERAEYNTIVLAIDEEFNLITVADTTSGTQYFWDETPDQRLFQSIPDPKTGKTTLEPITNISVYIDDKGE